jgi:ABC-type uncharacterized transport system substrate-binding protein
MVRASIVVMGTTYMNRLILAALGLLLAASAGPASAQAGKKVLFINSYHQGYEWSDGIEQGAAKVLRASGAEVEFFRMDTKRNNDEKSKKAAGLAAKAQIEKVKPALVIVSDDNAVKYVLEPYYKNGGIPFVFCAVNWDASPYGLPYKNATGMIEVALTTQLVDKLREYAKGQRVGFLTVDNETERVEQKAYREQLKLKFAEERLVKTFAEFKAAFLELQGKVDVLLLGNYAGITGWNDAEAKAFVEASTRIPSGAMYDFMMPYAMLGLTKIATEQGVWAGGAAVKILGGTSPSAIPLARNKEGQIMVNVRLAAKGNIVFKPELVRNAVVLK